MPELIDSLQGQAVILLVEPDAGEQALVRQALKQAGAEVELRVEAQPQAALDSLRRMEGLTGESLPDLILCTVEAPGADSSELVHALKSHPRLRRIPVVALTRLESESAVREFYDLRANAYVVKAPDFTEFVEQMRALHRYWFRTVSRPPR